MSSVNVMQLSAAVKRAEEGVKQGRTLRLLAWQTLYNDALSITKEGPLKRNLIYRLDNLSGHIEKFSGRI